MRGAIHHTWGAGGTFNDYLETLHYEVSDTTAADFATLGVVGNDEVQQRRDG